MITIVLLQMMGSKEEAFRPGYLGVPGHLSDLSNSRMVPERANHLAFVRLTPILGSARSNFGSKANRISPCREQKTTLEPNRASIAFRKKLNVHSRLQ
jgi:hypothetical protein